MSPRRKHTSPPEKQNTFLKQNTSPDDPKKTLTWRSHHLLSASLSLRRILWSMLRTRDFAALAVLGLMLVAANAEVFFQEDFTGVFPRYPMLPAGRCVPCSVK